MKEQLITLETAKLAKEKRLNVSSSHYYILNYSSFREDNILHKFSLPDTCDNKNIFQLVKVGKGQPHLVNVPTQSLLQKWLREIHSIDVNVITKRKDLGKFYGGFIDTNNSAVNKSYGSNFKTYEEALEMGLQKALNLI